MLRELDIHKNVWSYISEREQDCVSGWGLQEVGEEKKMLENEKYWNITSICEYNVICCELLNDRGAG
jgi:hypothetical protein